jgi:hypothetical protein
LIFDIGTAGRASCAAFVDVAAKDRGRCESDPEQPASHGTPVTLYGQEKDAATSGLARMNMILHNNPTALIVQGNTLTDPKFKDGGRRPQPCLRPCSPKRAANLRNCFQNQHHNLGFQESWKPVWTLSPGVPIGCRSPRKRGPYSMPKHSDSAVL